MESNSSALPNLGPVNPIIVRLQLTTTEKVVTSVKLSSGWTYRLEKSAGEVNTNRVPVKDKVNDMEIRLQLDEYS